MHQIGDIIHFDEHINYFICGVYLGQFNEGSHKVNWANVKKDMINLQWILLCPLITDIFREEIQEYVSKSVKI